MGPGLDRQTEMIFRFPLRQPGVLPSQFISEPRLFRTGGRE